MSRLTLSDTPVGKKVRLVAINGNAGMVRRFMALGLSLGAEVEVLHHRGRGVVVGRQGNRVALGGGMADRLQTEIVD
jgi:ferrous iron transport protein A